MRSQLPVGVRALLEARRLTLAQLGARVGKSESALSRWFRAGTKRGPALGELDRVAGALGVSMAQLARAMGRRFDERPLEVEIEWAVGAGEEVRAEPADAAGHEVAVLHQLRDPTRLRAVRVIGQSMPPLKPGWILIYPSENYPVSELIGRLAVVELSDGRRYVKELLREQGRLVLASWRWRQDHVDLKGAHVVRAAPVVMILAG
jgi:transcriptional regulator with XRE-family HTH domain